MLTELIYERGMRQKVNASEYRTVIEGFRHLAGARAAERLHLVVRLRGAGLRAGTVRGSGLAGMSQRAWFELFATLDFRADALELLLEAEYVSLPAQRLRSMDFRDMLHAGVPSQYLRAALAAGLTDLDEVTPGFIDGLPAKALAEYAT